MIGFNYFCNNNCSVEIIYFELKEAIPVNIGKFLRFLLASFGI